MGPPIAKCITMTIVNRSKFNGCAEGAIYNYTVMIEQGYVSASLHGLDFLGRYELRDYFDSLRPLVIFGMYRDEDLKLFERHPSDVIVVWQGSDAMKLTKEWADRLKKRTAKHYSISHWITASLEAFDIDSQYAPITATKGTSNPVPRGNSVYFYTSHESQESSDHYGEFMIPEIRERTGLNIITATYQTYDKANLHDIYRDCFINLRLTKYDGCPNGNLELGLLGRRSVFNGMIPNSLRWGSVDDICQTVMREYYNRNQDNREIAELTEIYVNSVNDIFK